MLGFVVVVGEIVCLVSEGSLGLRSEGSLCRLLSYLEGERRIAMRKAALRSTGAGGVCMAAGCALSVGADSDRRRAVFEFLAGKEVQGGGGERHGSVSNDEGVLVQSDHPPSLESHHLGSLLSSNVVHDVGLLVAGRLAIVVGPRLLRLVADVAERGLALLAGQQVLAALLPVEGAARGALAARLDVDVGVLAHAQEPLDELERDVDGLQVARVGPVVGVRLEVLLALGLLHADPAEPLEALGALDLGAAAADEGDGHAALVVGAGLGALLHVDLVEARLHLAVALGDLGHHAGELGEQVDAVDHAALERVHVLLAVQAEVVLTVLAPTSVLFAFNHSGATTSRNRTPAHVVHRSNRVLHTELLVLLHHTSIQVQVLDVQVVETPLTVDICALQLANLAIVDLGDDQICQALGAVIVLAARQE